MSSTVWTDSIGTQETSSGGQYPLDLQRPSIAETEPFEYRVLGARNFGLKHELVPYHGQFGKPRYVHLDARKQRERDEASALLCRNRNDTGQWFRRSPRILTGYFGVSFRKSREQTPALIRSPVRHGAYRINRAAPRIGNHRLTASADGISIRSSGNKATNPG